MHRDFGEKFLALPRKTEPAQGSVIMHNYSRLEGLDVYINKIRQVAVCWR
jgi:hypothetical protein